MITQMIIDKVVIICGVVVIAVIAIKYIHKYHILRHELRPDTVLAELTPIVVAVNEVWNTLKEFSIIIYERIWHPNSSDNKLMDNPYCFDLLGCDAYPSVMGGIIYNSK